MAATTGLFVIAGSVGAAIWALVGRKRDEPAEPDEAAQPDAVPVSEEQFET